MVKKSEIRLSEEDVKILEAAERFGIDLTLLEGNLRLTPTERLEKLRARLLFSQEIERTRAMKPCKA